MTREYDLLEIEDGKVKSINKCSMPGFLDLCNLPHIKWDIVMNDISMKDIIMEVLKKHKNVSLFYEAGIDEVASALVEEFRVRLGFKGVDK